MYSNQCHVKLARCSSGFFWNHQCINARIVKWRTTDFFWVFFFNFKYVRISTFNYKEITPSDRAVMLSMILKLANGEIPLSLHNPVQVCERGRVKNAAGLIAKNKSISCVQHNSSAFEYVEADQQERARKCGRCCKASHDRRYCTSSTSQTIPSTTVTSQFPPSTPTTLEPTHLGSTVIPPDDPGKYWCYSYAYQFSKNYMQIEVIEKRIVVKKHVFWLLEYYQGSKHVFWFSEYHKGSEHVSQTTPTKMNLMLLVIMWAMLSSNINCINDFSLMECDIFPQHLLEEDIFEDNVTEKTEFQSILSEKISALCSYHLKKMTEILRQNEYTQTWPVDISLNCRFLLWSYWIGIKGSF